MEYLDDFWKMGSRSMMGSTRARISRCEASRSSWPSAATLIVLCERATSRSVGMAGGAVRYPRSAARSATQLPPVDLHAASAYACRIHTLPIISCSKHHVFWFSPCMAQLVNYYDSAKKSSISNFKLLAIPRI